MSPANRVKGRVLFLSYYFPPAAAIACVRTWALAKYLSRLGWEITVVTPKEEFWAETHQDPLLEDDWSQIGPSAQAVAWRALCQEPGPPSILFLAESARAFPGGYSDLASSLW